MNNKILIGSIIAVTVLIGVSFTSVVGYRRVNSDVKESPLFNIRSSRAVDEDSKRLSNDYVGKGDRIWLQIPTKDNSTTLIQKTINIIQKMNEKDFNRLQHLIISNIHRNKNSINIDVGSIQLALNQIKSNSNNIKNNLLQLDGGNKIKDPLITITCFGICFPTVQIYRPWCDIVMFIIALITIIGDILVYIADLLTINFCWS